MRVGVAAWLVVLAMGGVAAAKTFVWVDEEGVTHITDDRSRVPAEVLSQHHDPEAVRSLWDGPVDPSASAAEAGAGEPVDLAEARTRRLLRAAVEDLERGENARAAAQLRAILREQPGRPEAHWYLALLDRHRGRYDSAEEHLETFLATAGDDLEDWRASARRRLAALVDERRLADSTREHAGGPWAELASPYFRVTLDPELGQAAPDYARRVLRYLEEARRSVSQRLGAEPEEPMGVVFYGRASYDEAHRHRFSFRTVGFFDGRIHVVSAAHPAGELRALLYHEYTHAVFRERTGGDRPYWLNEGFAELAERESRSQPGLTRSEREGLARRIDAGEWIPLRRLAPSFAGLDDEEARAAYLEATAAAGWIEAHSDRAARGRLLDRIGVGVSADEAFVELLGMDTPALEVALKRWIASEFPAPRPLSAEAAAP